MADGDVPSGEVYEEAGNEEGGEGAVAGVGVGEGGRVEVGEGTDAGADGDALCGVSERGG